MQDTRINLIVQFHKKSVIIGIKYTKYVGKITQTFEILIYQLFVFIIKIYLFQNHFETKKKKKNCNLNSREIFLTFYEIIL